MFCQLSVAQIANESGEANVMDTSQRSLCTLFEQLGLSADPASVDRFITEHSPLDPAVHIVDAPFWRPAQSSFLKQQMTADAEWVEVVDELNVRLRGQ